MKIAFVGCGYVFDIYLRTRWAYPELEITGLFDIDAARAAVVSKHYGVHVYPSYDALLADDSVDIVVNLTSTRSHYDVIKHALEAGKHVYSEKPLTLDVAQTRELFDLAQRAGQVLSGAPCNVFSDAIRTARKAVDDGAIGRPVLVYAELDDNPAHLMNLERVQSPTGAPFPYAEELEAGCTVEHVGYHLIWLCAMFGPVQSVTANSRCLIQPKTRTPLNPPDTPDLSVAVLTFGDGVTARVTCSWVSPRDHSFRIVGEEGEVTVDNVFHDQSPVHLERFSRESLSFRKAYTVRTQPLIGRWFGIGGRRVPLVHHWKSYAVEAERGVGTSIKHRAVSWLRRREVYAQDKFLGISEMAEAIRADGPQPLPPDFLLHLNELTLMIQAAGSDGLAMRPTTTFSGTIELPDHPVETTPPASYLAAYRPRILERASARGVDALHRS